MTVILLPLFLDLDSSNVIINTISNKLCVNQCMQVEFEDVIGGVNHLFIFNCWSV